MEEYDNPEVYDWENDYLSDLPFLLNYARKADGKVIDLAGGTGRISIPLAEKGIQMVCVDIHKGMIEHGRIKGKNLQIEWVCQDLRELSLSVKSEFMFMTGNAFQHFLTNEDQDKLLHRVREHLQKDGLFIFNTRFPSKEELLQPETEEYWRSYQDGDLNKIDMFTISKYDPLTQIQHYQTIRRIGKDQSVSNIYLRYTYPNEFQRLLPANGFEIVNIYEDWNGNELTSSAESMIYVCKAI